MPDDPPSRTSTFEPTGATNGETSLKEVSRRARALVQEVGRAVRGKRRALAEITTALLAGGHVLLEDVPGVAKTLTARSLARVLGAEFKRVQFTPDLLPADVTGSYVYRSSDGGFDFRPGPLFANLVLADEINRAPPKTQAALLEAMEEGQVTVEGTTHDLPEPFLVVATQNPIEQEGTYELPEAQLDRFMLRTSLGYPSREVEIDIVQRRRDRRRDDVDLRELMSPAAWTRMQAAVERVRVDDALVSYLVEIVRRTREDERLSLGSSPRGTLHTFKLARARAALNGRSYVVPDDVRSVAPSGLEHRVRLQGRERIEGRDARGIIREIAGEVPVPAD